MGRLIVGCAAAFAAALLVLFPTPAAAGLADLVGNWTVQEPSNEVTRIVVSRGAGASMRLRFYTRGCEPTACSSGDLTANPFAINANATLEQDAVALMVRHTAVFGGGDQVNAVRTLIVVLTSDGARYELFTDYPPRSGRTDYVETGTLRPLTARVPPNVVGVQIRPTRPREDCVNFDLANVRLVNEGDQWRIMEGSRQLLNFGTYRVAAERGLQIIQLYGYNSQCSIPVISPVIANPQPTMMYWRRDGVVPGPSLAGETCFPFNPARVQAVEFVEGHWHVAHVRPAGTLSFLYFGSERLLAERAAEVIRFYGITRKCWVSGDGSNYLMQYWRTD